MKYTTGQINRDSLLGNFIFAMVLKNQEIKTIVESGTWNGLGTTKCVLDALRPDQEFWSIELYGDMYLEALENNIKWQKDPRVHFLKGAVVSFEETKWFDHSTLDLQNDPHAALWYLKDMSNLRSCENILKDLPPNIDLLILDGGEYSTYPEWVNLKDRTKIVVLDDTAILKCSRIVSELSKDPTYTCIYNAPTERNGFAIYEKNSK